jgi:hypothetical protein
MPVRRPTQVPKWATAGTNVLEPSSGRKIAGWLPGMAPAAEFFNWWMNLVGHWSDWLGQESYNHRAIALATPFVTASILSGSHNWHDGAVCDAGASIGRVQPRYWVVGDDGAGNTAMAFSDSAGAAWANETGSAQTGSLTRCAAHGTLCMAVGGNAWKLGGTTNAFGTLPLGALGKWVAYDAVNNLWVVASSGGIYTSPPTAIVWTQRATGNYLGVVHYDGRTYALKEDVPGTAQVFSSTNGTAWASAASFAVTGAPERILASEEGVFVVTANAKLFHSSVFGAALTFVDRTPTTVNPTGAFVWQGLCLPGIYLSHGAAANQWKGVFFSLGVSEVIAGGDHGAIAVNGAAIAYVFGPTPSFAALPYAP